MEPVPGGASNWSIGGDGSMSGGDPTYGKPPRAAADPSFTHGGRARESSNSYANGNSQNTGNFISDRASTRVSNAPGENILLAVLFCFAISHAHALSIELMT